MSSTTIAWSSRALATACAFFMACSDRTLGDDPTQGSTTSESGTTAPTEQPEAETIRKRCELIVGCELGWDDQAVCEQDHAERLAGYRADDTKSPDCVPATLDFWACGNEAADCHAFWYVWSLVEMAGRCADAKARVCEARCGSCVSDT
jgi:hypothetical protein